MSEVRINTDIRRLESELDLAKYDNELLQKTINRQRNTICNLSQALKEAEGMIEWQGITIKQFKEGFEDAFDRNIYETDEEYFVAKKGSENKWRRRNYTRS